MAGKGRKRREKNYRAAHGSHTRLPPPPDPSKVDALPSKLRQIISFTSSQRQEVKDGFRVPASARASKEIKKKRRKEQGNAEKIEVDEEVLKTSQLEDSGDDSLGDKSPEEKRKKKRKSFLDNDRRCEIDVDSSSSRAKRRERKKKYLEARKKKNKKAQTEGDVDFPRHEKIKFGDVVEAPPKLTVVPKGVKIAQDASQERLRLQAIEAYRERRGWAARPGIQLSSLTTSLAL